MLVEACLALAKQVLEIRRKNNGIDSKEEDDLLDELDVLWYKMSDHERLKVEGTLKTW